MDAAKDGTERVRTGPGPSAMTSAVDAPRDTELRRGAVTMSGVMLQAMTHIGPALGVIGFLPVIVGFAGKAAPFTYLVGCLILLSVASGLTQLARLMPSAGGYFTYLSRTVHPRAGFMTGWTMLSFELLVPSQLLAYGGYILQTSLRSAYGVTFPWWIFVLLGAALLFAVSFYGIKLSVGTAALLCGLEAAIIIGLAVHGLISPGPGGDTLAGFSPTSASSGNGLYLAIVFTILLATGFDSAVPLAEETRDPRRAIPRAVIFSLVISSVFFVFSAWGVLAGWGTDRVGSFTETAGNPVFDLAKHMWGDWWLLLVFAVVNTTLGVSLAAQSAATRVLFDMGRKGVLPPRLGRTHRRHRTPVGAIAIQTGITVVVGLLLGAFLGPEDWFVTAGMAFTFGWILMYLAGNLGVIRVYTGRERARLRPLLHVVLPLVSSIALVWVGYKSLIPLPKAPEIYGPLGLVGWLLLGVAVLVVARTRGREQWMVEALRPPADEQHGEEAPRGRGE